MALCLCKKTQNAENIMVVFRHFLTNQLFFPKHLLLGVISHPFVSMLFALSHFGGHLDVTPNHMFGYVHHAELPNRQTVKTEKVS